MPKLWCDSVQGDGLYSVISFGKCNHCGLHFEIRANKHIECRVRSGVRPKEPWNPKSQLIFESGILIKHPRTDIPKWHWEPKDVRPEHGEYWSPRGIGYDLSGFVKSKRQVKGFMK